MESITQRLIDGKIEYDPGSLELSSYKLELTVQKNDTLRGSFFITSRNGNEVRGRVQSSLIRMRCPSEEFKGTKAEIFYEFSAAGMDEGDIQKGEFAIISSAGEYKIPFTVSVAHALLPSLMGPVKNLFHFANLAKTNWDEAVSLFYDPRFSTLFYGNDARYLSAYVGLSRTPGNQQNVDEFLVEISKKQPIEYLPMEDHIRMEDQGGISRGRITITRKGWGYTALAIETDGDFLSTEKKVLTDDDFLGNICNFGFFVNSEALHGGNNYGYVRLFNHSVDMKIEILVCRSQPKKAFTFSSKKELRSLTVSMMDQYAEFRAKRLPLNIWLKQSQKIVDRMNELDQKSIPARLFHAQLLITQDKKNDAKWILDRVEPDLGYAKRRPEHWCYYLYLTTLIRTDRVYVDEVTRQVEQIFDHNPENWRIAWLILYLREEFRKSPYKKWTFLEHQFYEGCKSPVLYIEAIAVLNANPTLLVKLSAFEIQVLNYAGKKNMLGREVVLQIQVLASKIKSYSERMFLILQKSYEAAKDDETLSILCSFLIKSGKYGDEFFPWYALGVERELKVTKLYEYYMMSLPQDGQRQIPKMVMMYFAYHSELDYQKNAMLCAEVYRSRDQYPDIWLAYRQPTQQFLLEQIDLGHIDKNLAYLYGELVTPQMLQGERALRFITLMFSNLITVRDDHCRRIVLIYDHMRDESVYPVSDRTARVPIYDSSYRILLEDESGNRKIAGDPYSIEKLMIPGRLVKELAVFAQGHPGLNLYFCQGERGVVITEKNAQCFRRLWESDKPGDAYRKEIQIKLAQYYCRNDMLGEADAIIAAVNPETMNMKERAAFMDLMVQRSMYDRAYSWLGRFGMEQTDPVVVLRLLSRMLIRTEFQKDDVMLLLSYHAFACGKYDENVLRYLAAYYDGTTKDMRDLWKAAKGFEVDVNQLCERILLQILFSGYYIGEKNEMFYSYVKSGASRQVELAYLTVSAYDYFVRGHVVDEKIFTYFTRLFYRGEELHDVCRLAYLKFYADRRQEEAQEVQGLVQQFLEYFIGKGMIFPFFAEYAGKVKCAAAYADETMIEYRTAPGRRVVLHYLLQTDEENGEYVTQIMPEMYAGIHVRSFTLFFGETLQYYITEESGQGEQLTQSATVGKDDDALSVRSDSKYTAVDDLVTARVLQDYSGFYKMYEAYLKKEDLVMKLFSPDDAK